MKRFVEEYPEFRKLGGNVSKHVALVGELSRLVGRDKLLEVGEVEQGLATSSGADFKVALPNSARVIFSLTPYLERAGCGHGPRSSTLEQAASGDALCVEVSEDANSQYRVADQLLVG